MLYRVGCVVKSKINLIYFMSLFCLLKVNRYQDDDLVDLLTSGASPQESEEQHYKPHFSGKNMYRC